MNVPIINQHTDNLRKELLKSLNKRFDHIINHDIFLVSTFLDPNFGISSFEPDFQNTVKTKIIPLTKISEAKQTALNTIENSKISSAAVERMFSIAGHILLWKRRKMSVKLFCY